MKYTTGIIAINIKVDPRLPNK